MATTVPLALGELRVESVPNTVDRIEVATSSGETITGLCVDPHLIPKLMSLGSACAWCPSQVLGDGTMRFLTADGAQAFPSQSIVWKDEARQDRQGHPAPAAPSAEEMPRP